MSKQTATRSAITAEYYSNILMVSDRMAPLTTVSDKRAEWYVSRGLAEYLPAEETAKFEGYGKVVRLKFKPKLENEGDPFYRQIIETRCVVCGSKEGLSLHHVVPSVIRKHLPDEDKNHSHGWCVLLCERHHAQADRVALQVHEESIKDFDKFMIELKKQMKDAWAKTFIKKHGGVEALKETYRQKFKALDPLFLPEGFLEDHKNRPEIHLTNPPQPTNVQL